MFQQTKNIKKKNEQKICLTMKKKTTKHKIMRKKINKDDQKLQSVI